MQTVIQSSDVFSILEQQKCMSYILMLYGMHIWIEYHDWYLNLKKKKRKKDRYVFRQDWS